MILHAERMAGVKPTLVMILLEAGNLCDFQISEGLRTMAVQQRYVAEGKSQTLHSKHLTGDAVDVAVVKDGKITWEFREYAQVAAIVKAVAKKHGVAITWGGDWTSLKDGPHFELDTGVAV